jgi:hypothetical protein
MVSVTVPSSLPVPPLPLIQLALLEDVQVQPAVVDTETFLVAPSAGTLLIVVGLT